LINIKSFRLKAMRQQYLLLSLAGIAGLANAEMTIVGTSTFANTKYFPTNCENSNTGEKTNEFWTYNNPSSTDYRYPDYKYYVDPTGNLWWEGNSDVYVIDNSLGANDQMQVMLNPNAHSEPAGTLVGALRETKSNTYHPCYVTPPDQMRVDFFNGWVCYRLYTCSRIPHTVTSVVISKDKTTMDVTQNPYENLMYGLINQMNSANGEIALIPTYEQTFTDNEGNSYSFVVQVENNGPFNLFWTIQAATQNYPHVNANPAASSFDEAYTNGVIGGDAQFPQSASIITYVGLDHTAYSKIDFFQTSFSPAPPPSPNCDTTGFGVGSGAAGVLSGILGALSVAAAPETGGASLAIAAGVVGAASGALGIAGSVAC
jgi:hypothetical protein